MKKNDGSVKLSFSIEIEGDWPPVSSESVWCKQVGDCYQLENVPFFIERLAFGDLFSAVGDLTNGQIFDFEVIEKSGHSVVWMLSNDRLDVSSQLKAFEEIGCRIEGFPTFSLYSFDVPPSIQLNLFDEIILECEALGLNFAYPTWRFDD
jgi:hypothetical protein